MHDYLRNGQCVACVHPVWDAHRELGEHDGRVRDARDAAESISSYLSALPTIRVHPELDGHTLDIVHCFYNKTFFTLNSRFFGTDKIANSVNRAGDD